MINSRVVVDGELNVFKTLFNNKYFWIVFLFEMGVQNAIIWFAESGLVSALCGVAPLEWYMSLTCWILALITLGVRAGAQFIKKEAFKFMIDHVNLETDNDDNFITKGVKKASDNYNRLAGEANLEASHAEETADKNKLKRMQSDVGSKDRM